VGKNVLFFGSPFADELVAGKGVLHFFYFLVQIVILFHKHE
jgi:hypothetical protein